MLFIALAGQQKKDKYSFVTYLSINTNHAVNSHMIYHWMLKTIVKSSDHEPKGLIFAGKLGAWPFFAFFEPVVL